MRRPLGHALLLAAVSCVLLLPTAVAEPAGPACASGVPGQRVLACHNRSHYTFRSCDTGELELGKFTHTKRLFQ